MSIKRCTAATFTRSSLITGNHDGFQRPIFAGRFRVIVAQGTATIRWQLSQPSTIHRNRMHYRSKVKGEVSCISPQHRAFKRVAQA